MEIKEILDKMGQRLKTAYDQSDPLVQDELRQVHSLLTNLRNEIALLVDTRPKSMKPVYKEPIHSEKSMHVNFEEEKIGGIGTPVFVYAKKGYDSTEMHAELMPTGIKEIRKFLKKMTALYGEIIKIEKI